MAKKKKHRKSNRSRKQRLQAQATGVSTDRTVQDREENLDPVKKNLSTTPTANAKPTKDQLIYDDVELSYVKEDITKTLVLIGIILTVYLAIWLLMSYTSFGTQLLHVFSR